MKQLTPKGVRVGLDESAAQTALFFFDWRNLGLRVTLVYHNS